MDEGYSITYGSDGNIYAAGFSARSTTSDFTAISVTPQDTQRWVYTYSGPTNNGGRALSIVRGADGNIYAAGKSYIGNSEDFTVVSLTSGGTQRWVYNYNGPGNGNDGANAVIFGADGNIYACGYSTGSGTGADFTVISLTSNGTQRWVYRLSPIGDPECANSIVYGADGNIYATGISYGGSIPGDDFTVVSLTTAGTQRWVYRYNGPGNSIDGGTSIVWGNDGNLYTAGYSTWPGGQYATVISLTPNNTFRWYSITGTTSTYSAFYSIIYLSGNVYCAGCISRAAPNGLNALLVSFTASDGAYRWSYESNLLYEDCLASITYGGGYIYSVGKSTLSTDPSTLVTKNNTDGNVWLSTILSRSEGEGICYGTDGYIYTTGKHNADFLIMKISPDVIGVAESGEIQGDWQKFFTATFFNKEIRIKFTSIKEGFTEIGLYDVCGEKVYGAQLSIPVGTITVRDNSIERLPAGIYFLKVRNEKEGIYSSVKLIKE